VKTLEGAPSVPQKKVGSSLQGGGNELDVAVSKMAKALAFWLASAVRASKMTALALAVSKMTALEPLFLVEVEPLGPWAGGEVVVPLGPTWRYRI